MNTIFGRKQRIPKNSWNAHALLASDIGGAIRFLVVRPRKINGALNTRFINELGMRSTGLREVDGSSVLISVCIAARHVNRRLITIKGMSSHWWLNGFANRVMVSAIDASSI
jgi:hypothetical protein